jgi:hypothetical protein
MNTSNTSSTNNDGNGGAAALPFERWAEVVASTSHLPIEERFERIEAMGVDLDAWEASDRAWSKEIALEIANGAFTYAERLGAACFAEVQRRQQHQQQEQQQRDDEHAPATEKTDDKEDKDDNETLPSADVRAAMALPFRASAEDDVALLLMASSSAAATPRRAGDGSDGQTLSPEQHRFRSASASSALPFTPSVRLEDYAALHARRMAGGELTDELLGRYGVPDREAYDRVCTYWRGRFANDTALREEWLSLVERHHDKR